MIEKDLVTKNRTFWRRSLSIMWRIFYSYIFFKGSILVTRPSSIMWQIFYNQIFFKKFYFGDKSFLNHVAIFLKLHHLQYFFEKIFVNYVANFLQLHHLLNVVFWWQDLCQSCGAFSRTTSSSECCFLVTRSLSIMWRIFYNYIIFSMLYFVN